MGTTDINISLGANTAGIQQALSDIRQSVNQYSKNITSNFQTVNQTLNETRNKFATINNAIDQARNKWTDWAEKTQVIRNSFRIATVAVTTLHNAVAVPLREFSRFEDAATRLAPLVGGLDAAKILCAQLRDEAANGTMSFEQLTSVAGRLASVFKSSSDIKKWTTAFHNLSAGTGLDINELIGNFVKSKASGRFEAGFLDMFAQKGVNIFQELAEQTGITETELRKMAAAGTLSFAEVEKAILAVSTGTGQFAGQAAKMSDTFNGSVGTMIENWKTFLAEVGKPIAAAVKFVVEPLGKIPLILRDIIHLGLDDETIYYQGLIDASQTLQRAFDSMETAKNAAQLKDAAEQARRAAHDLSESTSLNTQIIRENIYALERKKAAELELAEATRKRAEAEALAVENHQKGIAALAKLEQKRLIAEKESELADADIRDRPSLFLKQHRYNTEKELNDDVEFHKRIADASRTETTWINEHFVKRYENILDLQERYNELSAAARKEEQEKAEALEKANYEYELRKTILEYELQGQTELARKLEKRNELENRRDARTEQYKKDGMTDEVAVARSQAIFENELALEERKNLEKRLTNTHTDTGALGAGTVSSEQASVGGGRSLSIGMSGAIDVARNQLSVAQKMRDLLAQVVENTAATPNPARIL